jgi:hypothetical protein
MGQLSADDWGQVSLCEASRGGRSFVHGHGRIITRPMWTELSTVWPFLSYRLTFFASKLSFINAY